MEDGVRINKFLSEAGVCSRREADRQIEEGNVLIDGQVATTGTRVQKGQSVLFCGREVAKEEEDILLVMNKPVGIVCTAEKREKNNVIDYLNYPKRVYPIGRLDKDSEGLLLLTNQGDLVNKMMRAGNYHEKEYIVTVNRPITEYFLRGMAGGVPLVELDATTRKCKVEQLGKKTFRIVLTQGLNRQIRRMCQYFDYRVEKLVRVRIMNIELGDLKPGSYRQVTKEELTKLNALLAKSYSAPKGTEKEKAERKEAANKAKKEAKAREKRDDYRASGKNGERKASSARSKAVSHLTGTFQAGPRLDYKERKELERKQKEEAKKKANHEA